MKFLTMVTLIAAVVVLAGCQCQSNPVAGPFGANQDDCGKPVYRRPDCSSPTVLRTTIEQYHNEWFGCSPAPQPQAVAQEGCDPADLPSEVNPGEVWCCVKVQPPAAAPEKVCVCPERVVEIPVPGVYETVTEEVPDQPARTEWRRVECPTSGSEECWALVTIPATTRTVSRQVEVTPPGVRRETIPAQYELRASAPPPAYWEWRRIPECETPATTGDNHPPAGPAAPR